VEHEKPKRDLAQAASLAGAILAAIVGADPFDIRHRSHWVQDIDYVAIVLWVIAVVLFLLVLARPGRLVLLRLAVAGAVGAAVLTVVALLTLPFGVSLDKDFVELRLAPKERHALDRLCGTKGIPLRGSVPTSSLESTFVVFSFESSIAVRCDDVRIPSAAILAIREHPPH
jgi:hypothetical protein